MISPQNHVIPRAFSLIQGCTNNVEEYNALLIGLHIAHELGVKHLQAYGDSELIVCQVRGEYEVKHENLIPYHQAVLRLAEEFDNFYLGHIPRRYNTHADALASLATSLALPGGTSVKVLVFARDLYYQRFTSQQTKDEGANSPPTEVLETSTSKGSRDWRSPIVDYVMYDVRPDDPKKATAIWRKAQQYQYDAETQTLYRGTRAGILLRCLSPREAREIVKEAHDGTCGAHQPGPKLGDRIRRLGYYWPKMMKDADNYAKRCHTCQIHADFKHQPVAPLAPMQATWPIEMWGMDVICPINPPSSRGHRFILAITDYFLKWAEAIPLREVKATNVCINTCDSIGVIGLISPAFCLMSNKLVGIPCRYYKFI